MTSTARRYWLLKAEPDSRVVKGKDVKFSVDDFEALKTSPWEGVRNYEARNLMKEMKIKDKALFYHSNCKNPGVAGFAEVAKEAYPDYTAWDESHPYFDPKSKSDDPKWFMVDLTFVSHADHFVPLTLLRYIAETSQIPHELNYIGEDGHTAIKNMDLVTRGRLSVQRVEEKAWETIALLAAKGGWDGLELRSKRGKAATTVTPSKRTPAEPRTRRTPTKSKPTPQSKMDEGIEDSEDADETEDQDDDNDDDDDYQASEKDEPKKRGRGKRKRKGDSDDEYISPRRGSNRLKRTS